VGVKKKRGSRDPPEPSKPSAATTLTGTSRKRMTEGRRRGKRPFYNQVGKNVGVKASADEIQRGKGAGLGFGEELRFSGYVKRKTFPSYTWRTFHRDAIQAGRPAGSRNFSSEGMTPLSSVIFRFREGLGREGGVSRCHLQESSIEMAYFFKIGVKCSRKSPAPHRLADPENN